MTHEYIQGAEIVLRSGNMYNIIRFTSLELDSMKGEEEIFGKMIIQKWKKVKEAKI